MITLTMEDSFENRQRALDICASEPAAHLSLIWTVFMGPYAGNGGRLMKIPARRMVISPYFPASISDQIKADLQKRFLTEAPYPEKYHICIEMPSNNGPRPKNRHYFPLPQGDLRGLE